MPARHPAGTAGKALSSLGDGLSLIHIYAYDQPAVCGPVAADGVPGIPAQCDSGPADDFQIHGIVVLVPGGVERLAHPFERSGESHQLLVEFRTVSNDVGRILILCVPLPKIVHQLQ